MKILHCSDLHLGRRLYGYSLLEDQACILNQILELAREKGAEALILAGDVYDRSDPSAEAVKLLDEFLTRAADQGLPCLITAGNHDSPQRVAYGGQLMRSRGIYLSPVLSGPLEPVTLEDQFGPVDFYLLPFLKPAHVRAIWPEEEIGDYTQAVAAVLAHTEFTPGRRRVIAAHQFVVSGGRQPALSDSETLSVGGLDQVDASVFDGFDYVALGHIHRPQSMGRETVRYSGSPLKYSISEWNQQKSLPLVTLGVEGVEQIELLPLNPRRELRQIQGPLETLISRSVVSQANPEDYLHVILTDISPLDPMERLNTVYPNVLKLDLARAGEGESLPQAEPLERRDPLQLFAAFFRQQTGTDLDEESGGLVARLLSEEV